jgi:hypothetical protein
MRRRPDAADLAVAVAALGALALLLWLGRGLTFFADEWAVMAERSISLDSFLQPFNEHWLGVTTVLYRLLLETVGLASYMPYLAVLALLHLVVVAEVYVLGRRATAPTLAAMAAIIIAFFGSGFENLFWAMQIGFVGTIGLGLGAVILLDGRPSPARVVAATGLLTVGMMTSGFGLFMLAFTGLDLLLDPRRRRLVLALLVPASVYLGWYLVYGRSGVATARAPFTLEAILSVPRFVLEGAGTAFGSVVGVGPLLGQVAAVVLAVALLVRLVRRRPIPGRALACFGAILIQYGILGLIRAQLFEGAAEYSRYAYLSGIFALLGILSVIGHRPVPADPRRQLAVTAAVVGVFTLAMVWNVWLLIEGRVLFAARADNTRAAIVVATGDLPPGVDPDQAELLDRTITRLREIVVEFGSPLKDAVAGDAVQSPSPSLVERVRASIVEAAR